MVFEYFPNLNGGQENPSLRPLTTQYILLYIDIKIVELYITVTRQEAGGAWDGMVEVYQ